MNESDVMGKIKGLCVARSWTYYHPVKKRYSYSNLNNIG